MRRLLLFFVLLAFSAQAETPSEISVDLKLDHLDYVSGERIRGVIDVQNMSPYSVSVGYSNSVDRLFVEVYRSSDMMQLDRVSPRPFVSPFRVDANEGQKLEVFLGDRYALREERRYLARPVLVHRGVRYEGQYRAFDVVPGLYIGTALQQFANREGLSRVFRLVHWPRKGREHLFLTAADEGVSKRKWATTDIGAMMKITKPTVSVLPNGEVIVLHRAGAETFMRSEFWSLPDALEYRTRDLVKDPETAGQSRVQEMYNKRGGVKAKEQPWWKFW